MPVNRTAALVLAALALGFIAAATAKGATGSPVRGPAVEHGAMPRLGG